MLHKIKTNLPVDMPSVLLTEQVNVTSELIFKTKYLRQKDIQFPVCVNRASRRTRVCQILMEFVRWNTDNWWRCRHRIKNNSEWKFTFKLWPTFYSDVFFVRCHIL